MLKPKTASILSLARRPKGGRRGQWCAIRSMVGHALEASSHWPPVNASDIIAIQAVLIAAHKTSANSHGGVSRRGASATTAAKATLRVLGKSRSPAACSLLPTGPPVPATGAESILHRRTGRTGVVGHSAARGAATDRLARTTRLPNMQSGIGQSCFCRERSAVFAAVT